MDNTCHLEYPQSSFFQTCATGVPTMAQPMVTFLATTRACVYSLSLFSSLRIQNCWDIFLGSWTRLRSGIAVFLWSVFTFPCRPLGGWECYFPHWADSDTEAQPSQNAWCHTLWNQVVVFGLVHRPYMWKRLKLPLLFKDFWTEGYCQPKAFIHWVSSELGHPESKLHQPIQKTWPANASSDGHKHAISSGLHVIFLWNSHCN